jgi:hypothetical protein
MRPYGELMEETKPLIFRPARLPIQGQRRNMRFVLLVALIS